MNRFTQVTFRLLSQHWLISIAKLQDENERIQSVDLIPPSIRRANPNMTRDYYLANRSQAGFHGRDIL